MSESMRRKCIFFGIFFLLMILTVLLVFLRYQGVLGTYMHLLGGKEIHLEIRNPYEEKGVLVKKNFKDIKQGVQIQNNVNTKKTGKYEVSYIYEGKRINRIVYVEDTIAPVLMIQGEDNQIVFQNEEYVEAGVTITDNSMDDLSKRLIISHTINTAVIGEYIVKYQVKDFSENETVLERKVQVVENPMNSKLHYHYDAFNNERMGWWFKKANDHERKPPTYDETLMTKYRTFFLGPDEKVLYLTFDEGGSNITYIHEIADILNNHDVNATFFLTRNYILKESEFMNELVAQGHEIGNHTRSHYDMTTLANENDCTRFVSEIMDTQKAIYEVTKRLPEKIFRFPKGEFSERSLAMVSDLGFKTYFWSHAYNDYEGDVDPKITYNNLVSHLHHGAIYLLHPNNKGNYEAMNDFLLEAKRQGYTFELVSKIN